MMNCDGSRQADCSIQVDRLATAKARSLIVERRVASTTTSAQDTERRRCRGYVFVHYALSTEPNMSIACCS